MLNSFRLIVLGSLSLIYLYFNQELLDTSSSSSKALIPRAAVPQFGYQLSSPYPEATVVAGFAITVKWPQRTGEYKSYRVELWSNGKVGYIIQQDIETVEFSWRIPVTLGGRQEIRVFGKQFSDNQYVPHAISAFVIQQPPSSPEITVTSPTVRSSWVLNSKNTISFGYKGDAVYWSADIYCLNPSSSMYYGARLVEKKSLGGMTHTFTIPLEWPIGQYFIVYYIFVQADSALLAKSETFNLISYDNIVFATPEYITMTTPKFGAVATKGSTFKIEWNPLRQFDDFNIELFNYNSERYNPGTILVLAAKYPGSQKSFEWTVPADLYPSRYFYVRVWGYLAGSGSNGEDRISGVAYSEFFIIKSEAETADLEPECTKDCSNIVTTGGTQTTLTPKKLGKKSNASQAILFNSLYGLVATFLMAFFQ